MSKASQFLLYLPALFLLLMSGCPESRFSVVPDVVEMSLSDASAAIMAAGLVVGHVEEITDAVIPMGQIIRQDPAKGKHIAIGSSVNLAVSKGPEPTCDLNSGNAAAKHLIRVLAISFDPVLESRNRQRLHAYAGWNDPHALSVDFACGLLDAMSGHLGHEVVEWIVLDEWPARKDGFQFTDDDWLDIYESTNPEWPASTEYWTPSLYLDYESILERYDVAGRIRRDEIDQVWIFGYHYMGYVFFESRMAGSGAYWCNGPVIPGFSDCKPFLVYYFNYERDIDCMLENLGHAMEFILTRTYGRWDYKQPLEQMNTWERFSLYDKVAPGRAACGNVHFAPNSERDYDWSNPREVPSTWTNWKDYPVLDGLSTLSSCQDWGSGNMEAHHLWWFSLMPHVDGTDADGFLNDWWEYYFHPTGAY